MFRLSLNITVCFLFLHLTVLSKNNPIKYGEASLEELKMTVYEKDTSASAVILDNYGYFTANQFLFTQIIRIKILKKEGLSWANRTFPYLPDAKIEGVTFNFENDKIVKTELKSESVFKEKVIQNIERYRVSMPSVKVGSVFDIKIVGFGIPSVWNFQDLIPVKRSELFIENSPVISFRKQMFGFEPLRISEEGHWLAEDMPAFKIEPYISSADNYITKLEFSIVDFQSRNYYAAFNTSWENISRELEQNDYFGGALRGDSYLKDISKEIKIRANSDEEKLKMAFDYMKTFKWDRTESLFSSNSPLKFALNKKSGNSADLNIALIQLLNKLDIKAIPVVTSTRRNGFILPVSPSIESLNYVIALVNINNKQILIDATEEFAPYDLLPERCLNYYAQTVNSTKSELVEISTDKKEKKSVFYNLNLTEELKLTGTLGYSKFDYAALDFRNDFKRYVNEELYIEKKLQEDPNLQIVEYLIENVDSIYKPVKEKYQIILDNEVDVMGSEILLYPLLLEHFKENPFISEKRNYPVDFGYCREETGTIIINIPENFTVTSLPEGCNIKMPDNDAVFMYKAVQVGSAIQISFKYGINKPLFMENEYQDLRAFFNQIVLKYAQPITLSRN